jgi:hypothetical protein
VRAGPSGGVCLARWQVVKMFFGTGFEENGEGRIRGVGG